jgi:hypothetical protein
MKTKLEVGMECRHSSGNPARVVCTDRMDRNGGENTTLVLVQFNGWEHAYYCDQYGYDSDYQIVTPISEWDDFQIDEPVMVQDKDDEEWIRGYFAGLSDHGYPTTYPNGATSWSTQGMSRIRWKQCRRPTEGELNELA